MVKKRKNCCHSGLNDGEKEKQLLPQWAKWWRKRETIVATVGEMMVKKRNNCCHSGLNDGEKEKQLLSRLKRI
jgi:hypothetical protein